MKIPRIFCSILQRDSKHFERKSCDKNSERKKITRNGSDFVQPENRDSRIPSLTFSYRKAKNKWPKYLSEKLLFHVILIYKSNEYSSTDLDNQPRRVPRCPPRSNREVLIREINIHISEAE